jgi:hypothetical protein
MSSAGRKNSAITGKSRWRAGERAESCGLTSASSSICATRFAFIQIFASAVATNVIDLAGPKGVGITFEAPRKSLLEAVRWEIFDDLLIGNFTKTTLHGGLRSLYPDFTPYVLQVWR